MTILDGEYQENRPFSIRQLILGFLTGLLAGGACLVLDFFLGFALFQTHFFFLGTIATAAALVLLAIAVRKRFADIAFVRGALIALALAFIICTACGIAFMRSLNLR